MFVRLGRDNPICVLMVFAISTSGHGGPGHMLAKLLSVMGKLKGSQCKEFRLQCYSS